MTSVLAAGGDSQEAQIVTPISERAHARFARCSAIKRTSVVTIAASPTPSRCKILRSRSSIEMPQSSVSAFPSVVVIITLA